MSLRLICGRSGTGKSDYILNETIENLKDNKIYIITPEQFSFSAEKKLLDKVKNGSILNAEVLTFKRMAYRVLNEVGGATEVNLSKIGKSMLIYSILLENKKSLNFLGKSEENIDLVNRALTEFKKHGVTLDNLKNVTEKEDDKYLKEKLKDLSLIYEKFQEKIKNKYIDENDTLTILADNLSKTDMFKDTIIYIDEFTGYTTQEYRIIEELLKTAKKISITVTTDDLDMGTNPDIDVFYTNKQTADKLLFLARKNEIECEKTVFLNENLRLKNEELQNIEKNLYKIPYSIYNKEVKDISIFLASNPFLEVENVARQIVKLIKNEGYRYKDISIITKNMERYSSLTKAIFKNYNIPVFIDDKRNLSQNMFIKYIISILEIYSQNWSFDSVINYIKTYYCDIDKDEVYYLENYCRKWGIKGSKWYKDEWNYEEITEENKEKLIRLKELRDLIVKPLIELKEKIDNNKSCENISKNLYDFLTENKIDELLIAKKKELEEMKKIELANEQELSWNVLINVLDEMNMIFKDDKMTFDKYIKLLKIGLNQSGLGIIPQTQDEVILGDIERSRTHKIKAMFILGMNDGVFPTSHKEEGFLGDKDRENLKKKGIELAKGSLELIYEDNYSIYKAFTTPEEKLFLSYSSSDEEGAALRPSILINKIKKMYPKLKEESDLIEKKEDLIIKNLTFDNLIENLGKLKNGEEIDNKWFEIYNFYSQDEEWNKKLIEATKALNYINKPETITKENIEKLYGKTLNTTVSRLEKYKQCPFSYYLRYGLKVNDTKKFEISSLDTGSFMHDVIDTFFNTLRDRNLNVKEISEEEIQNIINEIVDEKLHLNKNYIFTSNEKYQLLARRLKRVILKSMKYIIEGLKQSDFEIFGTELEFKKGKTYKPIVLELEDGKKVEITGKIDRIDLGENEDGKYIRIIDYKSSVKNIDLNEVMAGLQIQLLTYLDAACEIEEVMPAGVLYFNLIDPIIKSKKSMTNEQIEEELRKEFKMKGLILADAKVIKMMDKSLDTGSSKIVPVSVNSDGSIGRKSSTINKEQFKELQKYTKKIIMEISKQILSGNIDINPYYNVNGKKTPCKYCEYNSICKFKSDSKDNNYNYIYKKEKEEILEEIRKENKKKK